MVENFFMAFRSSYQMGPESTPHSLKILIWITIGINLFSAFLPQIQPLLALSLDGVRHFYLWQFASYLFVPPISGGISFPFLLHLVFNMYLLWTFGASLIVRSKPSIFFSLYFGSGIFAALLAAGAMALFGLPYSLAGSSTSLYAILMAWMILNPEADILLFFSLPFKARWLILGLIGANLLIDLSNRDWIRFISFSGSAIFGYLFAIIAWSEQSPFPFLRFFERMLLRTVERLRHIGKKKPAPFKQTKIYDIQSGAPLFDDEQFMDTMLARISLYGEDSLTPDEKKRMKTISAKKSAQKK